MFMLSPLYTLQLFLMNQLVNKRFNLKNCLELFHYHIEIIRVFTYKHSNSKTWRSNKLLFEMHFGEYLNTI